MPIANSRDSVSAVNAMSPRAALDTTRSGFVIDAIAWIMAAAGAGASLLVHSRTTGDALKPSYGPWGATRYGWWFDLPVLPLFCALFTLGALMLLAARFSPVGRYRDMARSVTGGVAAAMGLAAVWYFAATVSGEIMVAGWAFGVVALMALFAWPAWYGSWRAAQSRRWLTFTLVLVMGPSIPLVQWAAPSMEAMAIAGGVYDVGEGKSRIIRPANSEGGLRLADVPRLGSLDSPFAIIGFFDYTSGASRATQRALLDLHDRFGSQAVVLPVLYPLAPECNPKVTSDMVGSDPDSCTYARLSLAVWLAKPSAFAKYHRLLVSATHRDQMPTADEARFKAGELVGEDAIRRTLADPRVDQLLAGGIAAKPRTLSSGLPSVEGGDDVVDLKPCVIWKGLEDYDPIFVTVGTFDSDSLLRRFEQATGAVPQSSVSDSTDDAASITSLLNFLSNSPDDGGTR